MKSQRGNAAGPRNKTALGRTMIGPQPRQGDMLGAIAAVSILIGVIQRPRNSIAASF
jgi:hypothetical protein